MFNLIRVVITSSRWYIGQADLIVYKFTSIKLYTTRISCDPFFLGGNFVRAPYGLLLRTMMPASSSSGKIRFTNSRSSLVYFGKVPLTGLALGSRSIECSIRSVVLISRILLAKQSFYVNTRRFTQSILSVESTIIPMLMPLSQNHSSISCIRAVLNSLYTRRRWVGNPSPFLNEYLVTNAAITGIFFLLIVSLGNYLLGAIGRSINNYVNYS